MDFKHFRTFIVAAGELHLGRTAERIGIAQPAVTQQIKTLEAALGYKVFHRVRRGIELTDGGAVFLEHARIALAQAEAAVLAGRRASRGELGKLSIAYAHSALLEPELPALLKRFAESRPDVDLELRKVAVQDQLNALADERIDVAFMRAPLGVLPESIAVMTFSRTPLDVVLPRGHAAAARRVVVLQELAEERFVMVDDPVGIGLGHRAWEVCRDAGFEPRSVLRVADSVGVVALVSAGLGVGLVPRSLARFAGEHSVFRPLTGTNVCTEILLATRAFDRAATTQQFLNLLKAD